MKTKIFTQEKGVKFILIRFMLAIVTHLDLEQHQIDVKIVFLNIDLDEKICID